MAGNHIFLCALLVAALYSGAVSSEETKSASKVKNLVSKQEPVETNFDIQTSDGTVWFVKFYAPWCGHCKRLAPTWEELAAEVTDDWTNIAHVDCTEEREICTQADVMGYPTLLVYHQGELKQRYKGPRDLDSLKKFIKDTANELLGDTAQPEPEVHEEGHKGEAEEEPEATK